MSILEWPDICEPTSFPDAPLSFGRDLIAGDRGGGRSTKQPLFLQGLFIRIITKTKTLWIPGLFQEATRSPLASASTSGFTFGFNTALDIHTYKFRAFL